MNSKNIRSLILEQLSELAPEADLSELDQEIDFREELDIDSFDFVRLITALSEALGVEVPEEDYTKLATLVGAEAYLGKKCRK
ncbi:MAG: acyl carrier protein [Gammaproteobacteria bacterium]|nr:MAG: acyl carrier protein [Gammaproteobacteria bacterium]